MTTKTLIIINEPFEEMALGKNTTLSYILAAFELGHDVYIANLDKATSLPRSLNSPIITLKVDKKAGGKLAKLYKSINKSIVVYTQSKEYAKLQTATTTQVSDVVKKMEQYSLNLCDINLVIQRLEPMKAPFPPQGNANVDDILHDIRTLLPTSLIFNCPIGIGDKEIPQKINDILLQNKHIGSDGTIAIATNQFRLGDNNLHAIFQPMIDEYRTLYNNSGMKIVLKPENSAQTLGVFAIEFDQEGDNLKTIKSHTVATLTESRTYKIQKDIREEELQDIITILCFIQRIRSQKDLFRKLNKKIIQDIEPPTLLKLAKELYNEQILVQPFLEGVRSGDIRMNYLKNSAGDFYLAGSVFRSSSKKKDNSEFTTAYITGNAISKPLSCLFVAEEDDLLTKSERMLSIINTNLKEQYQHITEFGADFILVGDNKTTRLSEINHHCQGLVPIAEAMEKASNLGSNYDGGLFLAKNFIKDMLALQKS